MAKNKLHSQLPVVHHSQLIRICCFSSCLSPSLLPRLPCRSQSRPVLLLQLQELSPFFVLIWFALGQALGIQFSASTIAYSHPVSFAEGNATMIILLLACSKTLKVSSLGSEDFPGIWNVHQTLLQLSLHLPVLTLSPTALFSSEGAFADLWAVLLLPFPYFNPCCLFKNPFLNTFVWLLPSHHDLSEMLSPEIRMTMMRKSNR